MLLLAACLCLYRWHTHSNPPVFMIKPANSNDGSFHTAGSGLLRSPASSVTPGSILDGREGSNSSLLANGLLPGSATNMQRPGQGASPSSGSPNASGGLPVQSTKSHIIESLNSVAVTSGRGVITFVSLDAAGTVRSWQGASSGATGSTDTTKIPRGSPVRGSMAGSGDSRTSSKVASNIYDSAGGSDQAALEFVRAEVHAAVQQLQVRIPAVIGLSLWLHGFYFGLVQNRSSLLVGFLVKVHEAIPKRKEKPLCRGSCRRRCMKMSWSCTTSLAGVAMGPSTMARCSSLHSLHACSYSVLMDPCSQ